MLTDSKQVESQIAAYVDTHAAEMISFLQQVVQFRSIWGHVDELGRLAGFLGSTLQTAGVRVDYWDSGTPGAPSVLGRVGRGRPERSLLFCGHFDVYPPSQSWSLDPFAGVIRDGKLYGAGSADMKGGTAAMTMAATVLSAIGQPTKGQVVVLAIPNHFEGGEGTRRALDAGLTANAGIVCEPTDLDIAAAQRGILYVKVRVRGVAAHTVATNLGVNAIEKARAVIDELRSHEFIRPNADEYGDQKIVNIAIIRGGVKHNIIPEECELTVDIRFSPSTTASAVMEDVQAALARIRQRDPRFVATAQAEETCLRNPRSPMAAAVHPFRDVLARVHRTFSGREPAVVCHPAWPDAPVLVGRGIPAVSYGPGSKLCYWDDEYVPIDEYLQAIRVYAATAVNWLNSESEE